MTFSVRFSFYRSRSMILRFSIPSIVVTIPLVVGCDPSSAPTSPPSSEREPEPFVPISSPAGESPSYRDESGRPYAGARRSKVSGLVFEPGDLDFGDRGHNEKITLPLVLRNDGTEPLSVSNAKPSCGCTTIQPTSLSKPITPGDSASFEVSMSSGRQVGSLKKYVTFTTSRGTDRVDVEMRLFKGLKTTRGSLRLLGECDGNPVSVTYDVTRAKGPAPTIVLDGVYVGTSATKRPSNDFETRLESIASGHRIHLSVLPTRPEGRFSGEIRATVDGKDFVVSFSGEMFRGIIPSESHFDFNGLDASKPETLRRTIQLRGIGGQPFEVIDAHVNLDRGPRDLFVEVRPAAFGAAAEHTIEAVLTIGAAPEKSTSFFGKARIETDHPEKPTLELRVLGVIPASR